MPKYSKGFTLVELLISISIIAVLTTIGSTVYRGIQKDAHDQKRLQSLKSIEVALETFRSNQGYYPADGNLNSLVKYLDGSLPTDPLPGWEYHYKALPASCILGTCTSYSLCAGKEGNKLNDYPCPEAGLMCGSVSCGLGFSSK